MKEVLRDYFEPFFNLLNYNIFALGDAKITPLSIIYLILLTVALIFISNKLKKLLVERVLERTKLDVGARQAVGTISRYFILFIGFLVILQTVGINLTTLNVLAGAVGIGVGFGLQNIASNFISGLIILLERPVKVGDRIEVGSIDGKVVAVGARSTRVKTGDNATIIIPNSKFITENVLNWSYHNKSARFHVPVKVDYESDVEKVKSILLEAAAENPNVMTDPAPAVRLLKFDDSGLSLELWVWSETQLHKKSSFVSELNFAVLKKFRKNNVQVPSAQSELFIRNSELKITDERAPINSGKEPEEASESAN